MDKKSSYTKQELLDIGAGKFFGKNNGKLPLPPMLMMDRIKEVITPMVKQERLA